MSEPIFLALDEVLTMHRRSIERFGGTHGLRDEGGFASAVNRRARISRAEWRGGSVRLESLLRRQDHHCRTSPRQTGPSRANCASKRNRRAGAEREARSWDARATPAAGLALRRRNAFLFRSCPAAHPAAVPRRMHFQNPGHGRPRRSRPARIAFSVCASRCWIRTPRFGGSCSCRRTSRLIDFII